MLITKTAGCGVLGDWAKQQGIWHSYTETPQAGDLVLFDFSGRHASRDHVGIVKSGGTSTIYTIEGNTGSDNQANGGAVMERQRSTTYVVGYIRPRYTSVQTAAQLVSIAKSQVGITEYPANSNKVKYNTWFYGSEVSGSAYPWCAAFVCWCFAVLAGDVIDTGTGSAKVARTACNVTGYVLKNGSVGEGVKTLQAALNARGYNCGTADGEFGDKTLSALKSYQSAKGLTADGECGALTWAKLLAV